MTINEEGITSILKDRLKKVLTSCNIHFIVGAGFNNNLLPVAKDLANVISMVSEHLIEQKESFAENARENLEDALSNVIKSNLVEDKNIQEITDAFKKGLKMDLEKDLFSKSISSYKANEKNEKNNSQDFLTVKSFFESLKYFNLENEKGGSGKLSKTYFWSLNYDDLINKFLEENNLLFFDIRKKESLTKFNLSILNNVSDKYEHVYYVTKLHGDIDEPIIPSFQKYNAFLQGKIDYFQIFMEFKNQLISSTKNSNLIFVIGYSGGDQHVNEVILEALSQNNIVVWLLFDSEVSGAEVESGESVKYLSSDSKNIDQLKTYISNKNLTFIKTNTPLKELTKFLNQISNRNIDEEGEIQNDG